MDLSDNSSSSGDFALSANPLNNGGAVPAPVLSVRPPTADPAGARGSVAAAASSGRAMQLSDDDDDDEVGLSLEERALFTPSASVAPAAQRRLAAASDLGAPVSFTPDTSSFLAGSNGLRAAPVVAITPTDSALGSVGGGGRRGASRSARSSFMLDGAPGALMPSITPPGSSSSRSATPSAAASFHVASNDAPAAQRLATAAAASDRRLMLTPDQASDKEKPLQPESLRQVASQLSAFDDDDFELQSNRSRESSTSPRKPLGATQQGANGTSAASTSNGAGGVKTGAGGVIVGMENVPSALFSPEFALREPPSASAPVSDDAGSHASEKSFKLAASPSPDAKAKSAAPVAAAAAPRHAEQRGALEQTEATARGVAVGEETASRTSLASQQASSRIAAQNAAATRISQQHTHARAELANSETAARQQLFSELDAAATALAASGVAQQTRAARRKALEAEAERGKAVDLVGTQYERDFLQRLAVPRFVELLRMHIGERLRALEAGAEPAAREAELVRAQAAEWQALLEAHAAARQRSEASRQRLLELDALQEGEREKLLADYNLRVASLQRRQAELRQRQHRAQRDKIEAAAEPGKRAAIADGEHYIAQQQLAARHRQLQGLCREHAFARAAAVMERDGAAEHAKLIASLRERLQRQRLSESRAGLLALQETEEPQRRSAIADAEAAAYRTAIVDEHSYSVAMLTADRSVRDGNTQLLRGMQAAVVETEREYAATVLHGSGGAFAFMRERCEILEREARGAIAQQQRVDVIATLVPAAKAVQAARRSDCGAAEARQRDSFVAEQQRGFDGIAAAAKRAAGGAHVSGALRDLQQSAEPAARRAVADAEASERETRVAAPHRAASMSDSVRRETARSVGRGQVEELEARQRGATLVAEFASGLAQMHVQYAASKQRAQRVEFERYAEPPRRREILMAEHIAVTDTLAPYCVSTWRPAVRRSFEEHEQGRRGVIAAERDAFVAKATSDTREARHGALLRVLRHVQDDAEPAARRAIVATEEPAARETLRAMLHNGVRFIARNAVFRQEEAARALVGRARELELGHHAQRHGLLRAQDRERQVIRKIEHNVAHSFFVVDAELLRCKAAMHRVFFDFEPRQRTLLESEERRAFYSSVLEPHLLMKVRAKAAELDRQRGERRAKIVQQYEAESRDFFARIGAQWYRAVRRDALFQDETRGRAAVLAEQQGGAERIEQEMSAWIKRAMRSLYERRELERAAAHGMRATMLAECEAAALLRRAMLESAAYVRRRQLLLRCFLSKKGLAASAVSAEHDMFMLTHKEQELRMLVTQHYHPMMLFTAALRRAEGAETLARRGIKADAKRLRSTLFLAKSFTALEGNDEITARGAIAADATGESAILIDEFVQRGEVLHRLQLVEERRRGVSALLQEPARLELLAGALHDRAFEATVERRSRDILIKPMLVELERCARREMRECWKSGVDALWVEFGAEMVVQAEAGRRRALSEHEQAGEFAAILRGYVVTGEALLRSRRERHEELEREWLHNAEEIEGMNVWDGLIRSGSVERQWRAGLGVLQRIELANRAALLIPSALGAPEAAARRTIEHASDQSKMVAVALEDKRRMTLRERIVRLDVHVRFFDAQCDAAREAIVREERDERATMLRDGGKHRGRFAVMAAEALRHDYEQGLRDLFLLQRWELTEREAVLRRVVPSEEHAAVGAVMQAEGRLYIEARYSEHLSVKLREFIVNPFVVDTLLWMRHVQSAHTVAAAEQRQRSLLAAQHDIVLLLRQDEPAQRRAIVEREAELRRRTAHEAFDSMFLQHSEQGVVREEHNARAALKLRFDAIRLQLRETYVREHMVGHAMHSLQGHDLSRALVEFELCGRANIRGRLEPEARAAISRPYALLQVESTEEAARRALVQQGAEAFLGGIAAAALFERYRMQRAHIVVQQEAAEWLRLRMLELASAATATERVARGSALVLEQRERAAIVRLRFVRGVEQLKEERCAAELDAIADCAYAPQQALIVQLRRGEAQAAEERVRAAALAALRADGFVDEGAADEADEERRLRRLFPNRFSAVRALPSRYAEFYERCMSKPSEIRREEEDIERDQKRESAFVASPPPPGDKENERRLLESDMRVMRAQRLDLQSSTRALDTGSQSRPGTALATTRSDTAAALQQQQQRRPGTATSSSRPLSPPTPVHDNFLFYSSAPAAKKQAQQRQRSSSPPLSPQQQQQQQEPPQAAFQPLFSSAPRADSIALSRPTSACFSFSRIQLAQSRPGTAVQRHIVSPPPSRVHSAASGEARPDTVPADVVSPVATTPDRPQSALMRGANKLKQVRATVRSGAPRSLIPFQPPESSSSSGAEGSIIARSNFDSGMEIAVPGSTGELFVASARVDYSALSQRTSAAAPAPSSPVPRAQQAPPTLRHVPTPPPTAPPARAAAVPIAAADDDDDGVFDLSASSSTSSLEF